MRSAVDVVKSRIQMHSTGEWYVSRCPHLDIATDSFASGLSLLWHESYERKAPVHCTRVRFEHVTLSSTRLICFAHSGFAPKVLRLAPGGGVLLLGTSRNSTHDPLRRLPLSCIIVVEALSTVFRKSLGPPYI